MDGDDAGPQLSGASSNRSGRSTESNQPPGRRKVLDCCDKFHTWSLQGRDQLAPGAEIMKNLCQGLDVE